MESINLIIEFLRNSNYPYPIEQRNLSSPIAKDFLNIFRFLYNRLEPYKDILKTEDIAGALKIIKYECNRFFFFFVIVNFNFSFIII
jgi:SMC interacting uncharacterized protein involved in chromosome segregation